MIPIICSYLNRNNESGDSIIDIATEHRTEICISNKGRLQGGNLRMLFFF